MRARGYNQVTEVLRYALHENHHALSLNTLTRIRDTRPQVELNRLERLTNMKEAFLVTRPESVAGKDIILVDDVVTTGATLHEAEAALMLHNPRSVTLLALAH